MAYSNFQLEQLMTNKEYKTLCDMFFSLAKDNETKEKLQSILYEGGYNGYSLSGGIGRDNPAAEIQRRCSLAYLIINNPMSFDALASNGVTFFHGTNANALPGIMKYGLNSLKKSSEQNIEVTTGETWSRMPSKRSFVSFTDVLDIAQYYSTMGSEQDNELSFPIVLGTSRENMMNYNPHGVPSDIPEVGVDDCFNKDDITCVMVPSNKVNMVKKIVGNNVIVLPMDNLENKFYYMDEGILEVINENYEKVSKQVEENQLKGVKNAVLSRALKNIKKLKEKLVNLAKGERIDGNGLSR